MLFCPIDCKESSLTEKRLPGPLLYLVCRRARCLAPFFSYHSCCGVRLFADDCVLYRPISSPADCDALQADLSNLEAWEHKWCMTFNLAKCNSMTVTRKNNKISHIYKLHNEELDRVNSATYLGLELTENLLWNRHIANSCNKATKTLSFLRRNLKVNNVNAKETTYKGLVRPTLEYCCAVWDPHYKKHIHMLEIVQRRAARFVLRRYHNTSSVTDMLQQLKWDLLCQRSARIRLAMLYKIQHIANSCNKATKTLSLYLVCRRRV